MTFLVSSASFQTREKLQKLFTNKLLLRHLLQLKIFSPSMINYLRYRSSHRRCSVKKLFLEISQSSQENTCTSLFFNKVACLGPETLLKKRLWHRLSCEFCEISKNTFSAEHSRRVLLTIILSGLVYKDKAAILPMVKPNILNSKFCSVFNIMFHVFSILSKVNCTEHALLY